VLFHGEAKLPERHNLDLALLVQRTRHVLEKLQIALEKWTPFSAGTVQVKLGHILAAAKNLEDCSDSGGGAIVTGGHDHKLHGMLFTVPHNFHLQFEVLRE
jgi:hypothetical protein